MMALYLFAPGPGWWLSLLHLRAWWKGRRHGPGSGCGGAGNGAASAGADGDAPVASSPSGRRSTPSSGSEPPAPSWRRWGWEASPPSPSPSWGARCGAGGLPDLPVPAIAPTPGPGQGRFAGRSPRGGHPSPGAHREPGDGGPGAGGRPHHPLVPSPTLPRRVNPGLDPGVVVEMARGPRWRWCPPWSPTNWKPWGPARIPSRGEGPRPAP